MMRDDEDGLHGAPWYVRAFIRVGLPTAFASALLWFLLTNVTGTLVQVSMMQTELTKSNAIIIENQSRIVQLLVEQSQVGEATANLLTALCYNIAENDVARARCMNAR